MKKNYYRIKQAELIEQAQSWQADESPKSWGEVAEKTNYFETQAKKYGLVKEFRENGII